MSSMDKEDLPVADKKQPGFISRLLDRIVPKWIGDEADVSYNWQQDAHRAYVEQQPLRAKFLLYSVAVIVVVLLVWSALALVDEVTRGEGKVIPSRRVQTIQSQDGGVVTEIHVRDGDIVNSGQLLVRLDQTRSRSSFRENRAEYQALAVKATRLRAILDGTEFKPDPNLVEAVPAIYAQESELYESSLEELELDKQIAGQQLVQRQEELVEIEAKVRQLKRSLALTEEELSVTRPMVASGAVSRIEVLRLEKEVNTLSGEYDQAVAQQQRFESSIREAERNLRNVEVEFFALSREELTSTISRMNALRELGEGLSDRVRQTEVRSPVKGTVKQVHVNTIGGVVLPGNTIIEIVPLDDTLLLEVKIKPKDIAFLVPGQSAMVKVTAYDFVVYGQLEGTVEHIGVDTVIDEEGNPYYPVKVRTSNAALGDDMPILPGMTVQVDILTGEKTILAYIMKPVLRAKQTALTER